ncbi:hypothetical protein KBY30_13405, partial [Ruegeria pomeroyi]|nr:hypothetical protein [Ruegeria pomeroyi]
TELVEQRTLRNLPRSHHQQLSCKSRELNQQPKHRSSRVFQQYPDGAVIRPIPGKVCFADMVLAGTIDRIW